MGTNFELWLLAALLVSVAICLLDKYYLAKKRSFAAKVPIIAQYAYELWPVFLLVFILRGFVFDLVTVPTGSMLPTIQLGDLIIVNKLAYKIPLPISDMALWQYATPKRGDVIVFKYPVNPKVYFVKAVIGVPGDHISYINKRLIINGQAIPQTYLTSVIEPNDSKTEPVKEYLTQLGSSSHYIFQMPSKPAGDFKDLVVPEGQYFVMGDNRDNSDDSRYWGMVPINNIIGKTWRIIFSWDSANNHIRWQRIGNMLTSRENA